MSSRLYATLIRAAKISIFLLSSKLFRSFFYLEGKNTNIICTFADAICGNRSEQEIFSYEINSVLLLFYSR